MKVACWSGPRNISTALMRSWSSRMDTFVSDEPFYAYYLKKTGANHPMKNAIIEKYETNYSKVIENISGSTPKNKKIWYQKQMAHHILEEKDFSWIQSFNNCFLIRNPGDVINSYIKKNALKNVEELGYLKQLQLINYLKKNNLDFYVIDSDDLLNNPSEILKKWCNRLNIMFDEKMLSWQKGPHKEDGIWGIHWYDNIYNSTCFMKKKSTIKVEPLENYKEIYEEALLYYQELYDMRIK